MNIKEMSYAEFRNARRGDMVVASQRWLRISHTITQPGGGVGMGEYPASITLILENGGVWTKDEWSKDPIEVAEGF